MKKFNFSILIFAAFSLLFFVSTSRAQDEFSDSDAPSNAKQANRPSLLSELNLSPDQIRQIRIINRENQPSLREAQRRLREARSDLDQAIYGDIVDENLVQSRLRNLHQAQAEVVRLRSTTEFAVRKVLTPDQLVRFRAVRQQYMEQKADQPNLRPNRPLNAPAQKLVNRQRRLRRNNLN